MRPVVASAPGKAVVAGEYAVLDGAPAVSMALNRRAYVTLQRSVEKRDFHTLAAPGYVDGCWTFRDGGGRLRWLDGVPYDGAFGLFEQLWAAAGPDCRGSFDVILDTRELHSAAGQKLGLGSSAALAVAAVAALSLREVSAGVQSDAATAHREFQGGRGSGVDIATSFCGGLIEYRRDRPVKKRDWPAGLHYKLFWSGQPAKTSAKLDRAANHAADKTLCDVAVSVAETLEAGSGSDLVDALSAYAGVLARYDVDRKLGIFDAGHRELASFAAGMSGVVYKPCGAGGGDIGIAVSMSAEALQEFEVFAAQQEFQVLDAQLDHRGCDVG